MIPCVLRWNVGFCEYMTPVGNAWGEGSILEILLIYCRPWLTGASRYFKVNRVPPISSRSRFTPCREGKCVVIRRWGHTVRGSASDLYITSDGGSGGRGRKCADRRVSL